MKINTREEGEFDVINSGIAPNLLVLRLNNCLNSLNSTCFLQGSKSTGELTTFPRPPMNGEGLDHFHFLRTTKSPNLYKGSIPVPL